MRALNQLLATLFVLGAAAGVFLMGEGTSLRRGFDPGLVGAGFILVMACLFGLRQCLIGLGIAVPGHRPDPLKAAGARYRRSGAVEDAYALGAADLGRGGALGAAPAGLCFLLPLAANIASGQQGRNVEAPARPYTALDPVEQAVVEVVHLCLSGTRGDLDPLLDSILFHPLFMAMSDLHRLNLKHWGLEDDDRDTPSFARTRDARPPAPLRRADLVMDGRSLMIEEVTTIARTIADAGAGPFAEPNLLPEIRFAESLPALFVEKAPRPWGEAESWFGGRPRLAGAAWPRHELSGGPLHFVAQISLRAMAQAGASALPQDEGWLAFFIGYDHAGLPQGAVVPVAGDRLPAETAIPDDAPPTRDYFTDDRPILPGADPRTFYRWPIRLRPAAISLEDIRQDFHAAVEARDGRRPSGFQAAALYAEAGLGTPDIWWYCAHDLAAHLAAIPVKNASAEDLVPFLGFIQEIRQEIRRNAAGKSLWQAMTPAEVIRLQGLCDRQRGFHHIIRSRALSAEELATRALRALLVTEHDTQAAVLPPAVRAIVETKYLRPAGTWRQWHQMFGPPATIQGASDLDHRADILLLHLAEDRVMDLKLGGQWQFWISPADLEAGRWQAATATVETD